MIRYFSRPTAPHCPYCGHRWHPAPHVCGMPVVTASGKPCLCRGMYRSDEKKPEPGHTWEGSDERD